MTTWIALLRGINVGGANKLAMKELRVSVASLGFSEVATYIQSGNLVFRTDEENEQHGEEQAVTARLRDMIADVHGLNAPVVVRHLAEFARAAEGHPDAAGDVDPKLLHVAFLDRVPDPKPVADIDPAAWAPDRWALDGRELYLTYPEGSARSKMTIDRFERPWDVTATARNLNSVRKILELARSV